MKYWRSVRIGEVCDLMTGGTPTRSNAEYYDRGAIPWLVSGDIHRGEIHHCEGRITEAGLKDSNAKWLPANSVIIALNGQGKTRGTVALLRMRATCNQSLVSICPKSADELLPEFLFWNLHGRYDEIRRITGDDGNERRGLNMPLIRNIEIPLPPPEEQRRIVAVLGEAFAAIATATANAETNVANARILGQRALHSLLEQHSDEWAEIEIRDVADVESGAGFPEHLQGRSDEIHPFFKVGDMNTPGNEVTMTVTNHTISEITRAKLRARLFPVGSVIFPKVGGAIATDKKRIIGRPSCVDNNVMGIIPKPGLLDAGLLHQLLMNKSLSEFANDAGLPSIRKSKVELWRVRLPRDLETQRLIACRLSDTATFVRELRDLYAMKLRTLDDLKQSLLHRAFAVELTHPERELVPA